MCVYVYWMGLFKDIEIIFSNVHTHTYLATPKNPAWNFMVINTIVLMYDIAMQFTDFKIQ